MIKFLKQTCGWNNSECNEKVKRVIFDGTHWHELCKQHSKEVIKSNKNAKVIR